MVGWMCLLMPVILSSATIKYCLQLKKGGQTDTQYNDLIFFSILSLPGYSTTLFSASVVKWTGRQLTSRDLPSLVEHRAPFTGRGCHIRLCHGRACHQFIRPASNGIPFLSATGDWARLGLTASQIHAESNTQTHRLWWIHLLGLLLPKGPMVNRNALNATVKLCSCPVGLLRG